MLQIHIYQTGIMKPGSPPYWRGGNNIRVNMSAWFSGIGMPNWWSTTYMNMDSYRLMRNAIKEDSRIMFGETKRMERIMNEEANQITKETA